MLHRTVPSHHLADDVQTRAHAVIHALNTSHRLTTTKSAIIPSLIHTSHAVSSLSYIITFQYQLYFHIRS